MSTTATPNRRNFPGITLSNGHTLRWIAASGALKFDGKGWAHERILHWILFILSFGIFRLIDTRNMTVIAKSVTLAPRKGNLKWWWPFSCIRLLWGGTVNKVGLTNMGVRAWYENIGQHISRDNIRMVGSAFGTEEEILAIIEYMNRCDLVGIEINVSCPNTEHGMPQSQAIFETIVAVLKVSHHPVLLKLSCDQPYMEIMRMLEEWKKKNPHSPSVEAVTLNSVPWKTVFGEKRTPLHRLEKRVGGGGGGVSGKAAQLHNWKALAEMANRTGFTTPVIGCSVWNYEDIPHLLEVIGVRAISFGAVFIQKPWAAARWSKRWDRTAH